MGPGNEPNRKEPASSVIRGRFYSFRKEGNLELRLQPQQLLQYVNRSYQLTIM